MAAIIEYGCIVKPTGYVSDKDYVYNNIINIPTR